MRAGKCRARRATAAAAPAGTRRAWCRRGQGFAIGCPMDAGGCGALSRNSAPARQAGPLVRDPPGPQVQPRWWSRQWRTSRGPGVWTAWPRARKPRPNCSVWRCSAGTWCRAAPTGRPRLTGRHVHLARARDLGGGTGPGRTGAARRAQSPRQRSATADRARDVPELLARPEGFEPSTFGSGGQRSIH